MKRIALLADIHGNSMALDAVLAHIQAQGGVEEYWILGDLCAIGYDPVGVLERLTALPNAIFIRGNADRFVISQDRPAPTLEEARQNPDLISILAEVAGGFAWTQGYVEARGWLEWLKALPLEHRLILPDGTHVLLVHAAPGTDDGEGLNPTLSDEEMRAALEGCEADLICVGHFHLPMERFIEWRHVINPGSISNGFRPHLTPIYAILSADETGYTIKHYHVDYDKQAALAAAACVSNPGIPYILKCMRGEMRAAWFSRWDEVSYFPTIHR